MNKPNWGRLILAGLVASIICFVTDGFFHEQIAKADWMAIFSNLGATPPPHNSSALIYFALFDLGRGFIAITIYLMMRQCCRPGPKTAAVAGIIAWIAFSVTCPAQFIPLGFMSNALWIKMCAFQLVTSIVATVAGAALYKDGLNSAAAQ